MAPAAATRDLDAVFVPSEVVRKAAAVAEREGLAEDWLNARSRGSCPALTRVGGDAEAAGVERGHGDVERGQA